MSVTYESKSIMYIKEKTACKDCTLTIEKFEITKTRFTKMLFWKINMSHVFIEVTKLKHDNKFP